MRNIFVIIIVALVSVCCNAQLQPIFEFKKAEPAVVDKPVEQKPVDVSYRLLHKTAAVGEESVIAVVLDMVGEGHLYANPNDDGIGLPTELVAGKINGVDFKTPLYPKGEFHEDKTGSGDMIYDGRAILYLPFTVESSFDSESFTADISLRGLYCTDTQCVPWGSSVQVVVPVGSSSVLNDADSSYFDDFNTANKVSSDISVSGVQGAGEVSVVVNIFFAMLAGLIMNIMPCVLPVIPLKVLSIIKQGQQARESGEKYKALKLALAFSAGIISLFAVLGLVLSGFNMAYGEQFQYFSFRLSMFLLVFIMALSMFGLFEIVLPSRVSNLSVVKDGYLGSFMMGIMATLLATPCSAPFLGGILYWALGQSAIMTLIIFVSIGVGMSLPYIILTAFPDLIDRMPTAGNWMIRLKEGLAFVMLGVVVYMVTCSMSSRCLACLHFVLRLHLGYG